MTVFWLDQPLILFKKTKITNIWPFKTLTMVQKLNAITRLVILLTILGYIITKRKSLFLIGLLVIFGIIVIHKNTIREPFGVKNDFFEINSDKYTNPTKENPMMNVMLPEIIENPRRKKAANSFEPSIEKKINNNVMNPRFFLDLGDNLNFDRSMRQFYTTPNTKIPNDQKDFAMWCYGDMPSCKEGSEIQCEKNQVRPRLY
jgi:hypothetical protein